MKVLYDTRITIYFYRQYKTIKEVIDTGTLIMMLTKAGAVLYFEKKNITKSQYEGIREIFEKNNILCKMKKINF